MSDHGHFIYQATEICMLRIRVHEMQTMVVEQRVELRNLETTVRNGEVQAEEETNKVLLLTADLVNMWKKVEEQGAELLAAENKKSWRKKMQLRSGNNSLCSQQCKDNN